MAMTEREQRDFRSYCASLLDKYGFKFTTTDPTTPIMYVIHKDLEATIDANKELATEIKAAASKINPTVFNFNTHGEAKAFQVGIGLKWLIISAPVLLLCCIGTWWYSITSDVKQARMIINNSGNIGELAKRVKKIDDFYVIDFVAAQQDSIKPFSEFQRLNTRVVRVYLGKERSESNSFK